MHRIPKTKLGKNVREALIVIVSAFLEGENEIATYYSEQQIEKARSIDLLRYLQTYESTEPVHIRGNTYCTREHDSLKISNGKWMWWSRGFGGASALDYSILIEESKGAD